MRKLLNRLAWRNLSLAAKTVLLFGLQMLLILLLGLIVRGSFEVFRSQLETGGTTAIEMRTLSNDLQIAVETLQRLEGRLVEQQYGWESFGVIEESMRREHATLTTQLLADSGRLEELAATLLGPEERVPVSVEVRTIQANAQSSEDNFSQMLDLVVALTEPETGALPLLDQYGNALEQSTVAQEDADLINQLLLLHTLEHTLATTGAQSDLRAFENAADTYLVIFQSIPAEEQDPTIPAGLQLYVEQARQVQQLLSQLQRVYRASRLSLGFARDAASRLSTITEALRQTQMEQLASLQANMNRTLIFSLLVMLLLGAALTLLYVRDLSNSMQNLLNVAGQLEAGNLTARASVRGQDEFSRLAMSFNAMAAQLEGLVSGLEQRVAERTRDLSITADLGRAVALRRDPRELMDEIVELIRQRFGFYHAQVFLVDDAGENANLVASTGRAGLELLARRHSLPVGSQSVIGQVTSRGEPIVASDTETSAIHRRNELLPDTRSEMALPMRVGDRVIGALDVQSVAPDAFNPDMVAVFQVLADQLAIALENARLQAQLADTQAALDMLQRRMTTEAWETYRQGRSGRTPLAYVVQGDSIGPHTDEIPGPLAEAIRSGQLIQTDSGDGEVSLAVPIRVRGEVIGAFGFTGETLCNLTEEDIRLVEAIVDRVGLALENLRLIEETSRRAEHEQILNEITAKIVGSTNVDQILQTTVRELGRVLRAPQTSVRLRQEGVDSQR